MPVQLNMPFFLSCFSVHIKVHVPEIIKKHTHHRTIYKHHYKVKPKPKKPKKAHSHYRHEPDPYPDHERLDPSVRHGTLHSKYQRPVWHDHQTSASVHRHEKRPHPRPHHDEMSASIDESSSGAAVSSPEIMSRWRQNFEMLNRKPIKKTKTKSEISPQSTRHATDVSEHANQSTLELFNFNEHFFGDNIQRKPFDQHIFRPMTGLPEHSNEKQKINTKAVIEKPHYLAFHSSDPTSMTLRSVFSPPHLLKITEEDIRKRPKSTTATAVAPAASSYGSDSYADWNLFEWPTDRTPDQVEHHYLRPSTSALRTMTDSVSQEEFRPFQQAARYLPGVDHATDINRERDDDDDDADADPEEAPSVSDGGAHLVFFKPSLTENMNHRLYETQKPPKWSKFVASDSLND